MSQNIIGNCPICNDELVATRLTCRQCGLELSNEFTLNKFTCLPEEDLFFIDTFLKCSGNIKEVQKIMKLSYPAVRKQLNKIQVRLGYQSPPGSQPKPEIILKQLPVYEDESQIITAIKEKLNQAGGLAVLSLPRGSDFSIWYEEYGTGLCASNLPGRYIITWQAIDCAMELITLKGGKAKKGNAMRSKLGEGDLTLDTVEGYVAANAYHMKNGDSVIRAISTLSAVLAWSGLVQNGYGYLYLQKDR